MNLVNHLFVLVVLLCAGTDRAEAVDTVAAEVATASYESATSDWHSAWGQTPRLVTLDAVDTGLSGVELIEARIQVLGEKTFSNREWTAYWREQVSTATALQLLAIPPESDLLGDWIALANDKVANQERYFAAIQSERDALEDHLEASFDSVAHELPSQAGTASANPYQRRTEKLDELKRRIDVQSARLLDTQGSIGFIKTQLATEAITAKAVSADLALANREWSLAQRGVSLNIDVDFWAHVSQLAQEKVSKIGSELDASYARERSGKIEAALAQSQLSFRQSRITEMEAELEGVSGFGTLIRATKDTISEWLSQKAWQAVLSLLLVFVGMRLALRGMAQGVDLILERADDNKDVSDEGDLRRNTLADVFSGVAKIAIYVVASLIAMEQIGVNTGPILGSVAILGLAVSFGSQNLVRDVVNGFFILLENQFSVGDVISVNGATGTVETITIRSTWIRQANGDLHTIPNGSISMVSNLTRGWAKATVEIGVGYTADLDVVEAVVNSVGEVMYADENWRPVLDEAPKWIGVTELGDSAVTVRCQVKVTSGNQWGVGRELNRRLKVAFDKAGIEIPFPQQVVHHIGSSS